jgi:glycosyltransferase involved in cell wall biosynthesis
MACGAIVIANPVGGIRDFVVDGQTGFLLKNNLPSTIASKVIDLWEHPGLSRVQKNALHFVKQNFSYKKAVQDLENLFCART